MAPKQKIRVVTDGPSDPVVLVDKGPHIPAVVVEQGKGPSRPVRTAYNLQVGQTYKIKYGKYSNVEVGGDVVVWTPLLPTTDGGVSAHTIMSPALGVTPFYQDSAKTTPVIADGDPVGAFDNPGTDNYDAVQAVTAAKLTYKTGVIAFNNKSVLRCDGGDLLQGTFSGGAISQPNTIIIVAQLNSSLVNNNSPYAILDGIGATRHAVLKDNGPSPDAFAMYAGTTVDDGDANGDVNIFTVLFSDASSQMWINGVSKVTGNAGLQSLGGLTIGALVNGAAGWVGDIAAILIYPGNLSNADKNQIGQWAADTYGLSYSDIT